uniref:Uncharacterized protein n=1 Tax=Chenopodium quinoa TaxID=63459 RepID=A0A803L174_CHEQI
MHNLSPQRMHQNSMVNNYSGRPDSFPPEDEHQYTSKKAEGQWRWERDAQQMSPQLYSDVILESGGKWKVVRKLFGWLSEAVVHAIDILRLLESLHK